MNDDQEYIVKKPKVKKMAEYLERPYYRLSYLDNDKIEETIRTAV